MDFEQPPPYVLGPALTRPNKPPITIAVMGGTGSGKSTFINLAAGATMRVSNNLESCTQDVQMAPDFKIGDQTIKLIDTPGFNDTDRSEVEILKLIADFLAFQYKEDKKLDGLLYLHRISDNRMGGASKRSFRLFRKLCGEATLKNVMIVTTMWDKVPPVQGESRERELKTDERFFKPALDDGARITRHQNTALSAHEAIRAIYEHEHSYVPLDIQKELVDEKKHLARTAVGQELGNDLLGSIGRVTEQVGDLQAEMRLPVAEDTRKELASELNKARRQYARLQNELANLQVGLEKDIDVERMWNIMSREARVMLMYRRSMGVQEVLGRYSFWATLGDTTKTAEMLTDLFDDHAMPLTLEKALFEQDKATFDIPLSVNRELKAWIKAHIKAVKEMEAIMEKTIRRANKQKRTRWRWRLW